MKHGRLFTTSCLYAPGCAHEKTPDAGCGAGVRGNSYGHSFRNACLYPRPAQQDALCQVGAWDALSVISSTLL